MFLKSASKRVLQNPWLSATLVAFACSLGALIGGTFLFVRQAESTLEQIARQAELSVRLREVQALLVNLLDAETSQRGYLVTGQARYLQPYEQAVAAMPSLLNQLTSIQVSDETLAAKIKNTHLLVGQKLADLAETIRLHDAGQAEAVVSAVVSDRGQTLMERVRDELNEVLAIVRTERDLLAASVASGEARSRSLLVLTVSLFGVFVVLTASQIFLLVRAGARSKRVLAESERFVRQITDSLPIRLAYVDRELRYRFANQALCKRFDMDPKEILGRSREELTGGVQHPRLHAALQGERQHFEYEEMVEGAMRRIETQLIPDVADNGVVQGIYTTGVDITERTAAERALRELTEIIEYTPDYVLQADACGAIQYLNPAVRRALGLQPEDAVKGLAFDDFHTPETKERFASEIVPAVQATGVWAGEATVYLQGKSVVPVSHVVIGHRDGTGAVVRYSAVMRDISVEVQARQRLLNETATLQSVTEAIPAMVAVNDADERYRFVNRAFESWFGTSREAMVGRTTLELLGQAEYERSRAWISKVQAGETVSFEKEFSDRHPPVHIAVSFIPLRLDNGALNGYVTVAQDVTHHRQEAVRLLQLSERDSLTGLLNRRGFESFLEQAMKAGGAASLALLYVDLDHFKPVNDQHGHPVGDELLREFGQRLRQLVRPTDAVARLGGDEFAIVLSGVPTQHQCGVVADKILNAAKTPFEVGGLQLYVGASVGIAFDASNDEGVAGLVRMADTRLYEAKASGRGRWA